MTKFPATRVLLILGVLASLCVSDNVGPRLVPLPPITELASTLGASDRGQAASPAPSQGRTERARVEMISAPQSRVGAERQSPQVAAYAPKFELAVPSAHYSLRRVKFPPLGESSAPFSRSKGRAPPRLA